MMGPYVERLFRKLLTMASVLKCVCVCSIITALRATCDSDARNIVDYNRNGCIVLLQ